MGQAPYRAEGIILKRKNVGETDRILTVFTSQFGKMRLIAKGIRRINSRRAPYLEVFSRVTLFIHHGKTIDGVTDVAAIATYGRIRTDLHRVSMAYFLCELIDALLPEKQEHRDVYLLFTNALAALDKGDDALMHAQSRRFALELLWALGFLPRGRKLAGRKLQSFIENITEKHLRTPQFVRKML